LRRSGLSTGWKTGRSVWWLSDEARPVLDIIDEWRGEALGSERWLGNLRGRHRELRIASYPVQKIVIEDREWHLGNDGERRRGLQLIGIAQVRENATRCRAALLIGRDLSATGIARRLGAGPFGSLAQKNARALLPRRFQLHQSDSRQNLIPASTPKLRACMKLAVVARDGPSPIP